MSPQEVARWLFSFDGRMGRSSFWKIYVPLLAVRFSEAEAILYALAESISSGYMTALVHYSFLFVYWTPLTWVGLAAVVRRLHDLDRTGWWVLVLLVPVPGAAVVLTMPLGFIPGTDGPNRFGEETGLEVDAVADLNANDR
jgi:uncharacterized membrane protein YhaH (DUF805 family)